ncbi:hypothetical protein L1987_09532 [Smallanthus sonchifolius]|uniref:Uncharacterized protein n=1 Tax=Smallanthus sonchifolius TaxID=185202 RepID=A0ACB9JNP3_9ASTR|nr:hypothetical protein L1987_09532 [Smallanthus sonchifolius]
MEWELEWLRLQFVLEEFLAAAAWADLVKLSDSVDRSSFSQPSNALTRFELQIRHTYPFEMAQLLLWALLLR